MNRIFVAAVFVIVFLGMATGAVASEGAESAQSIIMVFPFIFLLLGIAIIPLMRPHWWESNLNKAKFAGGCAVLPFMYLLFSSPTHLFHAGKEYEAFIIFLATLFTVGGGIYLRGDLRATPLTNTLFLAIGAVLSNLIGTTGASMVLIYALIRTNSERKNTLHTFIFFIMIVSNCGGCLLPIGDPPLYMGFLRGVPFFWTLRELFPVWLVQNGLLLLIYFIWDSIQFSREEIKQLVLDREMAEPLKFHGRRNLFLLGLVIFGVVKVESPWREVMFLLIIGASWYATPKNYREANHFEWSPIVEVAVLFAGIFVTMVPALQILEHSGPRLGVHEPWQYFWLAGMLSSFLDNAPTYLTFSSLASGTVGTSAEHLNELVAHPLGSQLLRAVSVGAVFMGANTYIGNAPNFMVKAICEKRKIAMPSFFGYMLYPACILFPLYFLVTLLFF